MIRQLGRYEVISELGQGAMGVVYKARDPLIDRIVAIKTINLGMAQEEKEEYEARFYQEAKAAGRLNHPNIVTIYDVGKSEDIAYIAMEFLQGRELRDVLREDGRMPVERVLDIVAQVASGLAYAHDHEIVHRDVKPSNIMVIQDGHVKITDFGIARMASSAIRTQTGMVLGSPKYMSPEQVLGKIIDQRSDIFSLGVMLYEMLTKEAPFVGDNINAIMYQTLNTVPVAPRTMNSEVPEMLNFIVAKALAKDLDDRYQNARDFAADLRACRDTLPRGDSSAYQGVDKKRLDTTAVADRTEMADGESPHLTTLGLSQVFDSNAATMRLAAMTNAPEEVDELAKTLKMAIPSAQAVRQAAPKSATPVTRAVTPPSYRATPVSRAKPVAPSGSINVKRVFLLLILLFVVIFALYIR
ncbi:MAG: protein kinase [Gallionella sp.]|jgi:serine/threonine-protein kinase